MLPLRDGTEHLQGESALRPRGVDSIAQGAEISPPGLQGLDHLTKLAHRTGQAIEAHHDQYLPRA